MKDINIKMKIPDNKQFIAFIKKYLKETGEAPSAFGRRVLRDSGAIPRLLNGRDPRLSTVKKIADEINGDDNAK
jgi:predicted transcriptional regulator